MKPTKFMKFLLLSVLFVLVLSACGATTPTLAPEMVASMNAHADQFDAQNPGNSDINVTRLCANNPAALYWHEETKIFAVVCLMELPGAGNTYGVVLIDAADNSVVHTEHINATSLAVLEDLIAPVGWVRK